MQGDLCCTGDPVCSTAQYGVLRLSLAKVYFVASTIQFFISL